MRPIDVETLLRGAVAPLFPFSPDAGVAPMTAYVRDGKLHLFFDLPGADADNVDVAVGRDRITVRAERRYLPDPLDIVLRKETPFGETERTVQFSGNLNKDDVTLAYVDGVLHVTVGLADKAAFARTYKLRS